MYRKIVTIVFLGVLLLAGFTMVTATINTVRERHHGTFEADMGLMGDDEPLVYLEGTYHARGRFIVIGGTATAGDTTGRFRGVFRGNYFVIRAPVRGNIRTIVGQYRFDEDQHIFTGVWIARGLSTRGWITGTFTPEE